MFEQDEMMMMMFTAHVHPDGAFSFAVHRADGWRMRSFPFRSFAFDMIDRSCRGGHYYRGGLVPHTFVRLEAGLSPFQSQSWSVMVSNSTKIDISAWSVRCTGRKAPPRYTKAAPSRVTTQSPASMTGGYIGGSSRRTCRDF